MPRKKKTTSDSAPAKTFNKSQFVREHASKSPKEIVALAKQAGHDIGVGLVYSVRTQTKANKGKVPGKRGPKPKGAASSAPTARKSSEGNHSNHKKTLRALCFLLGYQNVKILLDEIFIEIST